MLNPNDIPATIREAPNGAYFVLEHHLGQLPHQAGADGDCAICSLRATLGCTDSPVPSSASLRHWGAFLQLVADGTMRDAYLAIVAQNQHLCHQMPLDRSPAEATPRLLEELERRPAR